MTNYEGGRYQRNGTDFDNGNYGGGGGSSPPPRVDDYSDSKSQHRSRDHERDSSKSREKEREKGRDKERGRDRDRDRDKDRERVKNRERSRDRDRDRERDRDKDRDRHHRDLDHHKDRSEMGERGRYRDDDDYQRSRDYDRDRRRDNDLNREENGQSTSPSDHHHRSRHRSRSPRQDADRRERDEVTNTRGSEQWNEDDDSLAKLKAAEEALEAKQKQQPSFELSGKLAAETNRVRGVTLLFNEPPEASKPNIRWRLYVFKAGEVLNEPLYIHRQSCYLFGRERRVADIPTDHPSCSKQHAVIQFRRVEKEEPDGTISMQVRPYIMDLGSTNKTFINDNPIEPQRYYELFEKDTIKFGNSSREYVLLHENSAT
ncbi:nuclear inhibitor of protein phosphatase-1, putative [Ricinus communis]|uniref:Nuclear inhibitor of protein phosphatase-1, putative n=1 Tax=Ricinus communis TaxID=3988 RepID=B9SAI4_RICCO|nr:nuclear inhibitor of protein phosphatase-1, putative [Ricinus communis]|eukprot:XP_002523003.1 FHA domain-containing protein DDL isoform X1 [Ricinus communis]